MDLYIHYVWITVFGSVVHATTTEYLNLVCDVTRTLETSRRLEASTTITYKANTACYYHLVTDSSKLVFLYLRKFDLENTVNNVCVDYVNIHDGADTSATPLNTNPLCGVKRTASFYTSSGNQMTIYFQSDATGQSLGFEMIFSAVTNGTCSSSQTACVNTSVCIDGSLRCNKADECGDNTDEAGCVYPGSTGVELLPVYVIILCCVVGGILLITCCAVIGHLCWKYNKWRWYMNRPIKADKLELQPTTYESAYPVTKVYYKEKYQSMYHDIGSQTNYEARSFSVHNNIILSAELTANSQSVV